MTTFGLNAECGRLIEYDTVNDLRQLLHDGMLNHVLPLGGGSNMLFTRPECDLTVIHSLNRSISIRQLPDNDTVEITVGAGCELDSVCAHTASLGLWGLENLSGIPGEIGGAAVQNVGAYGAEFRDVVKSITCFEIPSGEIIRLSAAQCNYGYRDSMFKHQPADKQLIIIEATLNLRRTPSPKLGYSALSQKFAGIVPSDLSPQMLRDEVITLRNGKLPSPAQTGSAGSFFKNPVVSREQHQRMEASYGAPIPTHPAENGIDLKLSAAWLIDKAGCKSFICGGASLWPTQPLVIVNTDGNASGADIVALEKRIITTVDKRFGVRLTPEVIHI